MTFKDRVREYLKEKHVAVGRIEQDGEIESIVCHIMEDDNSKFEDFKYQMEEELNVVAMQSNGFGMNVIIVESKDL